MKRKFLLILMGHLLLMAIGCSGYGSRTDNLDAEQLPPRTIQATGFSQVGDEGGASFSQRWLIARQAAKLDAYRGLAEQLYKVPLGGTKTVGNRVVDDDNYRVYLDSFIRNAKQVDSRTVRNMLKTTLELRITSRFYRCMSGDSSMVGQCLHEENKLPLTRLGYRSADKLSVNLACGSQDCGDRFYVQGFSNNSDFVDGALLNAGFYDTEWFVHTGVSLIERIFLLEELVYGF